MTAGSLGSEAALKKNKFVVFLVIFGLASYFCFYNLGQISIGHGDENLYVRVTQSVLHGKAFFVPTTEGRVFVEKPPLKYWLSAIPPLVLGESNFSHRAMDALFGVITVMFASLLCFKKSNSRLLALLTALLLVSSERFLFNHGARHAVHDSMLVCFTTLSMWSIWGYHRAVTSPSALKYLALTALFTVCSIMSKSVAGLLPIPIILAFVFLCRTARSPKIPTKELFTYLFASLLIPVVYFVVAYVVQNPGEWRYAFGHQVFSRFKEGYHNAGQPWFYFERIFVDGVSITPILAMFSIAFVFSESFFKRDSFCSLLSLWIAVPLIGYSCLDSRLTWYVSPMFPALAIAGALSLYKLYDIAHENFLMKSICYLLFGTIALLISGDVFYNLSKINEQKRRYAFDEVAHGILHSIRQNPEAYSEQSVYWLKRKKLGFALHEKPYRLMLRAYMLSTNDYRKALSAVKSGEAKFVIAMSDDFYKLLSATDPIAYRLLPPLFDRGKWFGVLAYSDKAPKHFFELKKELNFPANSTSFVFKNNRIFSQFGAQVSFSIVETTPSNFQVRVAGQNLPIRQVHNKLVADIPSGLTRQETVKIEWSTVSQPIAVEITTNSSS